MPTIVDALVTTLTLDAREYIANAERQRQAMKSLSAEERQFLQDLKQYEREKQQVEREADRERKDREREREKQLKDEEQAEREHAKLQEELAKRQEQSIRKVALQATALLGIFTAGRGVKDFVMGLTQGDAAAGRLAKNIGMSVTEISRWQSVATNFGGSGEGVAQMFASWSDDINNAALTGQSTIIPLFQQLQVQITDAKGGLRSYGDILKDVAASPVFRAMSRPQQGAYLRRMGVEDGIANAVMDGPQALGKALAEQPVISQKDADNAILFEKNLARMENTSKALGRAIFNDLAPSINELLDMFKGIMDENGPEIAKDIGEGLKTIVTELRGVNWKQVGHEIHDVVSAINSVVQALGGWGRATELLFALWVGSKFLAMGRNVLSLVGLLGRIPGLGLAARAAQGAAGSIGLGGAAAGAAAAVGGAVVATVAADAVGRRLQAGGNVRPDAVDPSKTETSTATAARAGRDLFNYWTGRDRASTRPPTQTDQPPILPSHEPATTDLGQGRNRVTAEEVNRYKPLFDLIGRSEGTDRKRGYDETLAYGKWTGGNVNLRGMTLNDIDALQTQMLNKQYAQGISKDVASSALGRYQFTRTTLRDMREQFKLSGNMKFDELGQDQLAVLRLRMAGVRPNSGMDRNDELDRVAQIWASAPTRSGAGFYRGQQAHATPDEYRAALAQAHGRDPRNYASGAGGQMTNNSGDVNIGQVVIQTQATDAKGIARDVGSELQRYAYVRQANTGMRS